VCVGGGGGGGHVLRGQIFELLKVVCSCRFEVFELCFLVFHALRVVTILPVRSKPAMRLEFVFVFVFGFVFSVVCQTVKKSQVPNTRTKFLP
jgi:hypothetical protein